PSGLGPVGRRAANGSLHPLAPSLPLGMRNGRQGAARAGRGQKGGTGASAPRELIECAELAVRGPLLVKEGQLALVEFTEELVPFDRLEVCVVVVVVARKRDSEQPD